MAPPEHAPTVQILEVVRLDDSLHPSLRFAIDRPFPGEQTRTHGFTLQGWVFSGGPAVQAIELLHIGDVVRRSPIWLPRPDVASHFRDQENAAASGFHTTVGLVGLPPEFDLRLDAVLADETRVPIGRIRGRHGPIRTDYSPRLRPLLITSIGRTGTTWLMRILAEHPAVVSHRVYPYETRVAGHWLRLMKTLTDPGNPFDPPDPAAGESTQPRNPMFSVGYNPYSPESPVGVTALRSWLEAEHVTEVGRFCQQQVDAFYAHLARSQLQYEPRYFAEKFLANDIPWLVHQLYPEYREIFLIRDLRDVFCSILDFSATKPFARFGVDSGSSPEQYLEGLFYYSALCFLESWKLRSSTAILVRYEALILEPNVTLSSILDYLAIDGSPSTVSELLERADTPLPLLEQHRTSPDATSSIGRWRRDMSPSLQSASVRVLGGILSELGYTSDRP